MPCLWITWIAYLHSPSLLQVIYKMYKIILVRGYLCVRFVIIFLFWVVGPARWQCCVFDLRGLHIAILPFYCESYIKCIKLYWSGAICGEIHYNFLFWVVLVGPARWQCRVFELRGLHISILPPCCCCESYANKKMLKVDIHGCVWTFLFFDNVLDVNIGSWPSTARPALWREKIDFLSIQESLTKKPQIGTAQTGFWPLPL